MRIQNVGTKHLMFDDLNRGLGDVYRLHIKAPIYLAPGEYIDVLDSDKTAMSLDRGQVKTYLDAEEIDTAYSMIGIKRDAFEVTESENDTFLVNGQEFVFDEGHTTMDDVVEAINDAASGFVAELSQKPDEGLLVLVSENEITIGDGNANSHLGFFKNQKSLFK